MTRRTTLVLGSLATLIVCSGILSIDGAPILVAIFTLGFGVITWTFPTLATYEAAALPGLLLWARRGPTALWLPVSLVGIATMAVLPGLWASASATDEVQALQADDTASPLPQHPAHLRIVRRASVRAGARFEDTVPCEQACQQLLYGEDVLAVEVRAVDSKARTRSATWRRQPLPSCPDVFKSSRTVLDSTLAAMSRGDCLVPTEDETLPDAPWVLHHRWTYQDRKRASSSGLAELKDVHRLTAGRPDTPLDTPDVQRTEVRQDVLAWPLYFWMSSNHVMRMHLAPARSSRTTGDASLERALSDLFGFGLEAAPEEVPPSLDEVIRLLDQPGDEAFGTQRDARIRSVLQERMRDRGPLDARWTETLGRILSDARVQDADLAADLAGRHPEVLHELVPHLVARMRQPVPRNGGHAHNRAARVLASHNPAALTPYVDDLMVASLEDGTWATAPLLGVLPLIDDDTGTLLATGLAAEHTTVVRSALLGACVASAEVAEPLLDAVHARGLALDGTDVKAIAVVALTHHGRADLAESVRASVDARDQQRFDADVQRRQGPDGACTR